MSKSKVEKIADIILFDLFDLGAYIYHKAYTTNSIYIKFKRFPDKLKSVRISDHEGINKYTYTWNIRKDITEIKVELDRGTLRKYYPFSEVDRFINDITEIYNELTYLEKVEI